MAEEEPSSMGDNRESSAMLNMLTTLTEKMQAMEIRMGALEGDHNKDSHTDSETNVTPEDAYGPAPEDSFGPAPAHTANTVRANRATMQAVSERLAEWGLQDQDWQGPDQNFPLWRVGTKKSGAIIKGTDSVKHIIDWPHFYIRQGPRRTMPTFEDLTSTEFALGFLRMIRDPTSKLDLQRMLDVLSEILEDTIDFGWKSNKIG